MRPGTTDAEQRKFGIRPKQHSHSKEALARLRSSGVIATPGRNRTRTVLLLCRGPRSSVHPIKLGPFRTASALWNTYHETPSSLLVPPKSRQQRTQVHRKRDPGSKLRGSEIVAPARRVWGRKIQQKCKKTRN